MSFNAKEKDLLLSNTISYLRFPLIFAVLIIHTYITDQPSIGGQVLIPSGALPAFDTYEYIIRICIAELAVPVFFLISGFLFFYKVDFNVDSYINKIKRRFKSLVVPYFLWNFIYLIYMALAQYFVPSLASPDRKMIIDYNLWELLDSFWHFDGVSYGGPIYGPLWFIRDLIVISILTPLFYYLIKYYNSLFISVLIVLYVWGVGLLIPGLGIIGILFFCFGASFSIKGSSIISIPSKSFFSLLFLGLLFLIVDVIFRGESYHLYIHRLFIISWSVILPVTVSKITTLKKNNRILFLAECSFFVYVTHRFFITVPNKIWALIIPVNTFTACCALIIIPLLVSSFCISLYLLMKRIFPKLTSVLIGGR